MNLTDIANMRLASQQVAATQFTSAQEIVGWMGAMQAQDYAMMKWAVGVRLPGIMDDEVETAVTNAHIIRTHLLRPTWHLVSAHDIYWLLDLTAPKIKASLKTRHKELGLSAAIFAQSKAILENALSGGNQLSRAAIQTAFANANIATDNNRLSHLLMRAELDGILCSGSGKQTYALLAERVPKPTPLTREEALGKLAHRYFTSHGPATLPDFVWWSGLSGGDAKHALALVNAEFISETIDSQTYWFSPSISIPASNPESVYLLPAFDEFIISYKDRQAILPFEHHKKAVSNNGIFWPTIVVNGQVTGTWKRTLKKGKVLIETEFFATANKGTRNKIKAAAQSFAQFLGKEIEMPKERLAS